MANEKRLILLDHALQAVSEGYRTDMGKHDLDMIVANRKRLKAMPTVDAVEVVRCKNCKHWQHIEDGFGDCTNPRFNLPGHVDPTMELDGFCSCGERRNNG